jgi:hypothetical protein
LTAGVLASHGGSKAVSMKRKLWALGILALVPLSCAGEPPTVGEANETVLMLRQYGSWAWAVGIVLICADLALPIPQSSVVTALGIVYGAAVGGVVAYA